MRKKASRRSCPGTDCTTPPCRSTRRCLLTPSKSRFSTAATCVAHIGPRFTSIFTISHRSGLPSAAKKRGAFEGGATGCNAGGAIAVGVPVAAPEDEVEVLMPNISPDKPAQNKLKAGLIRRKNNLFDPNADIKGRINDVQQVNIGESWRKVWVFDPIDWVKMVNVEVQRANVG